MSVVLELCCFEWFQNVFFVLCTPLVVLELCCFEWFQNNHTHYNILIIVLELCCFVFIYHKKDCFIQSSYFLFPQAELAEELGDEFVWCGVTSDFAEDFPGASHIDLEKIYRHTHFQALVDGLQAF